MYHQKTTKALPRPSKATPFARRQPPSLAPLLLPPFAIRFGRRKSQVSAALRPVRDLHSREATRLDSFSMGVDR
ncbi:hypothetical protein C4D60_Mb08t13910 [Musa balbisiana]|uniref:Uncharacterized protein n=1 Tax=Musa balbisiana TaxID=52838 RepID=A0A4S8K3L3_MUSBA|nr:hypothetical protein C4D60_Mb08t13910 [Musa balbisiana]